MTNFWNIIVQSNTFNFAILLIMIAIVLVKLDIISIIEKIRQSVISKIENANFAKEDAQKQLNSGIFNFCLMKCMVKIVKVRVYLSKLLYFNLQDMC